MSVPAIGTGLWYNRHISTYMGVLELKRYIAVFAAVLILISGLSGVFKVEAEIRSLPFEVERFSDVPESHWAYEPVHYFRYLNITQGVGDNKFGLGQTVKKSEFITMLVRVMGWELVATDGSSFTDVGRDKWYHPYVETAVAHGAILKETGSFNPDKQITRMEIAQAIVRGLGYEEMVKQLKYMPSQFADVAEGSEYTNLVMDFGISNGNGAGSFQPDSTAKKEEAVAMLIRMYQRNNSSINELHAFYAIKSFEQAGMIQGLNSVSVGWSRLEYDSVSNRFSVAVTKTGNSDFHIPEGFSEPMNIAKQSGVPVQLNLYASNETKLQVAASGTKIGLVERLLTDAEAQSDVIMQVVQALNNTQEGAEVLSFDGIVVDFENLKGQEQSKLYSEFLAKLKVELVKYNKKLYVAVHPKRGNGQAYFDGYDYRAIGEVADKVILMAHDYNAVSLTESEMAAGYNDTPLTPAYEIYYALKAISDKNTGVSDLSKVWLQISFDTVQWKKTEGKVINQSAFRPSYTQLRERILKNEPGSELKMNYSQKLQNPWVTYHNTFDGTDNIIWYEDSRSVQAKLQLAKMFGINGVSLWRLGNIPDFEEPAGNSMNLNVWQTIKNQMGL